LSYVHKRLIGEAIAVIIKPIAALGTRYSTRHTATLTLQTAQRTLSAHAERLDHAVEALTCCGLINTTITIII
jgi:hypothetical protein